MRVSVKRIVNQVKRKNDDRHLSDRLLVAALLALYRENNADIITEYTQHHYTPAKFLQAAHRGYLGDPDSVLPVHNDQQETLNRLVPSARTINLYIPSSRRTVPDTCITLGRIPSGPAKGLWGVSNPRVRNFEGGNPPRDGVLAWWGDNTPPPMQAVAAPLKLQRVVRGGRSTACMVEEVENFYELRRQLSYWYRLSQALSNRQPGRLAVFHAHANGKAVFTVAPTEDADDPVYDFEGVGVRGGDKLQGKNVCVIFGDISEDFFFDVIGRQPRYFAARIKDGNHDNGLDPKTNALIRELLMLQHAPLIGLHTDDGTNVYCLHYDGEDIQPTFIATIQTKQDSVPSFRQHDRYYVPNYALLHMLKTALFERPHLEARNHKDRVSSVYKAFNFFVNMRHGWKAIDDLFSRVDMPITAQERSLLQEVAGY